MFVAFGETGELVLEQVLGTETAAVNEFFTRLGLGVVRVTRNDATASDWARIYRRQRANINFDAACFFILHFGIYKAT